MERAMNTERPHGGKCARWTSGRTTTPGSRSVMIGAMADISERKRALEIQEQRVAARTSELRTKNHELEHEIGRRQRVEELLRAKNEDLKAFAIESNLLRTADAMNLE